MNKFFLFNLIIHLLALTLLVLSQRSAPDLRRIALVYLLGSFSASLVQWIGHYVSQGAPPAVGFTLLAMILLIASWAHFLIFLAAPRFAFSANYWGLQAVLIVSALLSSSLMSAAPIDSITTSFITNFSTTALVITAGLVFFLVFIQKKGPVGVVEAFRAHSAQKIMLWSIALTILLLLSLPVTPATATTTATYCSCFAGFGIHYVVRERRLFLNDCARHALSAPGEPVSDSAIALASSSLDALGDLLSPNLDKRPGATSPHLSSNQAILAEIKTSNLYQEHVNGLYESLLSAEGEPHFEIHIDSIRPTLFSLSFLSKSHFGVDIIGNSLALMEILGTIREQGEENRLTILQGERGVGKRLFTRALHNIRGNGNLQHHHLADHTSLASFLDTIRTGSRTVPMSARSTLAISIAALRQNECTEALEQLQELQADNTDVILLLEDSHERASILDPLLSQHALLIRIPPLRERPEDVILQSLWYIDRFSTEHNLRIKGITASALRAALLEQWHLNTQELVDTVTVALSLQEPVQDRILDSFVVSPHSRPQNSNSYRVVQERLKLTFAQLGEAPPHIAQHLGISSEFASALAHQYRQEQIKAPSATIVTS